MWCEVFPIADYHKPQHVVQALYEIPYLEITQLPDEGITPEMTHVPAVSCCDVSTRLLRTCPHSAWMTDLLFKARSRFQSWFWSLLFSSYCLLSSISPLHLEAVLGILIQDPETTRERTAKPVVSE